MTRYVLEVVRYIHERDGPNGYMAKCGKLEHIGYMQALFKTKNNACSYYDRNNPHMRPLNRYGDYTSDNDPLTHFMYIVREDKGVNLTIAPFDEKDIPVVEILNGGVFIDFKFLK